MASLIGFAIDEYIKSGTAYLNVGDLKPLPSGPGGS